MTLCTVLVVLLSCLLVEVYNHTVPVRERCRIRVNTNRLNLLPVLYTDFEGNTLVRIIGVCLPDYMTSRPTRRLSPLHSCLIVLNVHHKCVFRYG